MRKNEGPKRPTANSAHKHYTITYDTFYICTMTTATTRTTTTMGRCCGSMRRPLLLLLLLLLLIMLDGDHVVVVTASTAAAATSTTDDQRHDDARYHHPPVFTLDDLQQAAVSTESESGAGQQPRRAIADEKLRDVLTTTGLLTIQLPSSSASPPSHAQTLNGLCQCIDELAADTKNKDDHSITTVLLQDGYTTRTTIATATIGTTSPLPLAEEEINRKCGGDNNANHQLAQSLEQLRDDVAHVAAVFSTALDRLLIASSSQRQRHQRPTPPLLSTIHGRTYTTVRSILQEANHLEHFHVYDNDSSNNHYHHAASSTADDDEDGRRRIRQRQHPQHPQAQATALDWHTDAGLFLAFVPGQKCGAGSDIIDHDDDGNDDVNDDTSFYIRHPGDDAGNNREQPVLFQRGTVAIMLGAGAEHWLDTSSRGLHLRATRHSVRMMGSRSDAQHHQRRAWYGIMHLVPESAIIDTASPGSTPRTFRDMRENMVLSATGNTGASVRSDDDTVTIGCGSEKEEVMPPTTPDSSSSSNNHVVTPRHRRRRLLHVQDASECNNATNFFCWMQCLDIPDAGNKQGRVNEGESLYCLDPAILASSGNKVSSAAAPCEAGYVHNANCLGSWQPTVPGVPAATVKVTSNLDDVDDKWCYGGTSMYMDGFNWVSTTCVIYLFPSWVLSSEGKLAAASIGTLFVGISLEKIIQVRRMTTMALSPGYRRLAVSALFYGFQLTVGYMLMLVVMTYSGPLFMCTVFGLVFGHILFNAKDAVFPGKHHAARTQKAATGAENVTKVGRCHCQDGEMSKTAEGEENDTEPGGCHCPDEEKSNGQLCADKYCAENEDDCDCDSNAGIPEGSTPCCQNTL